jgi:hypothetical protein
MTKPENKAGEQSRRTKPRQAEDGMANIHRIAIIALAVALIAPIAGAQIMPMPMRKNQPSPDLRYFQVRR